MINGLVLTKILNAKQLNRFVSCFNSYNDEFDKYKIDATYIVCDDSPSDWKGKVYKILEDSGRKYVVIENDIKTMYGAVLRLIEAVNEKYFLFIMDDVEFLGDGQINSSLEAFEDDDSLVQVKIGGGQILDKTTHKGLKLTVDGDNLKANFDILDKSISKPKDIIFCPTKIGKDIIWITEASEDVLPYEPWLVSHWSGILRSSLFKEINENMIELKAENLKTFEAHHYNINFVFTDELQKVYGKKIGWVNFVDYLFAHGMEDRKKEDGYYDKRKKNCRS
jgi:hypothetical protein